MKQVKPESLAETGVYILELALSHTKVAEDVDQAFTARP